jgi:hypothetical protein
LQQTSRRLVSRKHELDAQVGQGDVFGRAELRDDREERQHDVAGAQFDRHHGRIGVSRIIRIEVAGFGDARDRAFENMIAARLVPRDPTLARQILLISLCTWFIVDSTGSIVSGGNWNVLGNLFFLLVFLIPTLQLPTRSGQSG